MIAFEFLCEGMGKLYQKKAIHAAVAVGLQSISYNSDKHINHISKFQVNYNWPFYVFIRVSELTLPLKP